MHWVQIRVKNFEKTKHTQTVWIKQQQKKTSATTYRRPKTKAKKNCTKAVGNWVIVTCTHTTETLWMEIESLENYANEIGFHFFHVRSFFFVWMYIHISYHHNSFLKYLKSDWLAHIFRPNDILVIKIMCFIRVDRRCLHETTMKIVHKN